MYTDHDQFGISDEMMEVTNDDLQLVLEDQNNIKKDK